LFVMVNSTNLRGALAWGEDFLKRAGIDSPELTVQLLLCHLTERNRTGLLLHLEEGLSEAHWRGFKELVRTRASGFPLQYILGECDFYDVTLKVAPGVFIPRPETEILVEEVLTFFKGKEEAFVLDLGTGSGAIAIALAKNLPGAGIIATDISLEALKIARINAIENNVDDRVFFHASDLFEVFKNEVELQNRFDAIVSNPPYIAPGEKESLPKEVRDFEPPEALFAEEEGLFFHRRIIESAPTYLKPGGLLALEVALGQAKKVMELLESESRFQEVRIREDLTGIKRVICSLRT
jgi:release factor glutamine methyltransferase